jgi:ABC-type methionine transport system permease subunit
LLHAAGKQRLVPLDHGLIAAGRAMGTCFGDTVPHLYFSKSKPAVVV